ncbi:unnamed protein product, partial [Rotaria sp. Silwood2]
IYSYYLLYNPPSSLICDLLIRITLFEDFNLSINYLLSPKHISLIKIVEYSIKQIVSKEDEQWKQVEVNQLDQYEHVQQQEEILSDLLCKYGQFHLIALHLNKNTYTLLTMRLTITNFSDTFVLQVILFQRLLHLLL